jgi:hypothetical protein
MPLTAPNSLRPDRRFLTVAWCITASLVFWGFSRSFFLRPLFTAEPLSTLLYMHGFLMSAWFLLFIAQVGLVATHRIEWHRRLGVIGALLALLIVIAGALTSIRAMQLGHVPTGTTRDEGLLIGWLNFGVFAGLVSAALLLRRRSDYHKRLMLLATLSIAIAGIGRIPVERLPISDFWRSGGPYGLFSPDLLLPYAVVLWDTCRHRRLHVAFAAGLLWFVVLDRFAGDLVGGTLLWRRTADWILSTTF